MSVTRVALPRRLLGAYTRSFDRSPWVTLMVTNGTLMALGDVSAQVLFSGAGVSAYHAVRTMRFAVYGAAIGPVAGAWNKFLEDTFPLRTPPAPLERARVKKELNTLLGGRDFPLGAKEEKGWSGGTSSESAPPPPPGPINMLAILKRVACDQFILAPATLFVFLFSMGTMEGLDGDEIREKIRANYLPILFVNWQVWPILQAINFRYIPLQYRVPVGALMGIGWSAFLSLRTELGDVEPSAS